MWRKVRLILFSFLLVASFALPSITVNASFDNNNENEVHDTDNGQNEENGTENENETGIKDEGDSSDDELPDNGTDNNDESTENDNNNENNEENGNENENESDDEVCEELLKIKIGVETEVCAGQKVEFYDYYDFNHYITMPDDLPENSTLTILEVKNDQYTDEQIGVQLDGEELSLDHGDDAYEFNLNTEGEFTGQFTLSMAAGTGFTTDPGIYYYNENTNTWERLNDSLQDGVISAKLDHLSKYGLFYLAHEQEVEEEDYCEAEITVEFDDTVEVCAKQKINISDINDVITMPADLPDGSTITIADIGESEEILDMEDLLRCGGVYDINIEIPEGQGFNEEFSLMMNYCNGESADDIYFYNEANEEWEKTNGMFDYDEFTITTSSTINGKYGVFAIGYDQGTSTSKKENNNNNEEDKNGVKVIEKNNDNNNNDDGFILPSTATNLFNFILIGAALLLIGAIVIFVTRKRKASKE